MTDVSQGYCLYEGPSNFAKVPITVILTGLKNRSSNSKTGPMVQVFILFAGEKPTSAWAEGSYKAVCGDCKHGKDYLNSCYVELAQHGVNGVWKSWKNGKYPKIPVEELNEILRGESVRFGAYGDPAAVPYEIWEPILAGLQKSGGNWTSYTHAWKFCDERFKNFCVASVDSPEELELARKKGWRTYRTLIPGDEIAEGEFECPASDAQWQIALEKGKKTIKCIDCAACNGLAGKSQRRGSAVIRVHGRPHKVQSYTEFRIKGKVQSGELLAQVTE